MSLKERVNILIRRFEREFAVHNRIEVSRSAILQHSLQQSTIKPY